MGSAVSSSRGVWRLGEVCVHHVATRPWPLLSTCYGARSSCSRPRRQHVDDCRRPWQPRPQARTGREPSRHLERRGGNMLTVALPDLGHNLMWGRGCAAKPTSRATWWGSGEATSRTQHGAKNSNGGERKGDGEGVRRGVDEEGRVRR